MTGLVEINQWEAEIYQLETDDPVLGGEDGIDNLQAKQLANRTQYLKAQLLLRALIDSPAFTGTPIAPTAGQATNNTQIATTAFVKAAIAALVNSSPAALDTLNELAAALGNDANFAATMTAALALKSPLASPAFTGVPTAPTPANATNNTQLATTAYVKAVIADLIASAPGALDTLNELAAALGNDANFAATMTAALALKATLASPVFTGDPKAPTPAPGDNDTSIATTAFVQDAISQALYQSDYKASVRVATTAAINLAAPGANIDAVAMVNGDRFLDKDNATPALRGIYVWNGAAVAATRALDADTGAEFNSGATFAVEEGSVNADTRWQLVTDGVIVIGTTALTFSQHGVTPDSSTTVKGKVQLSTSGEAQALTDAFKAITPATLAAALQGSNQSLSANGYQKLPGGLILQWGLSALLVDDNTITVTFPIAFPNACLNVNATLNESAIVSGAWVPFVKSLTTTNFLLGADDVASSTITDQKGYWLAIGY